MAGDAVTRDRGTPIVWTKRHGKATSGLSEQHRVLDATRTMCMLAIPADENRILDLRVPVHVEHCTKCDTLYARGADLGAAFASLLAEVRENAA